MKKKAKSMSLLNIIRRILPQVASVDCKLFITNYIVFILNSALSIAAIFCTQILFDRVVYLADNKDKFIYAFLAVILLFTVKILIEITDGIANFIGENYDMKTGGKFCNIINIKMGKLDPICFENTEILDSINKSYLGIKSVRSFVNITMDIVTLYIPYFVFMGIYLFKLKPILLISLILVFIPVLFNQLIRVKAFSKLEDDSAPLRRKNKYYKECLTGREYLKETRILGACPYFIKLFKETLYDINNISWKTNFKINVMELLMKIISLCGYLGILWLLYDSLMNKDITVGAFAAVFASVDNMFSLMEEVICGRIPDCANKLGNLKNLIKFLDLPERYENKELEEEFNQGDIVLKDVSFKYPYSKNEALKNINLTIYKGETIALVGENGSGKSTLLRLITGLYIPEKGEVLHNNKSTKDIDGKVLFSFMSAVFQKYQRYKLTLRDNIKISEINNKLKKQEDIEKALVEANIEIVNKNFPNRYDTLLSREFGGIDLSGGQWQKIALARGLYRSHDLIVLDEPTSSIDPIEETKIYKAFSKISKNKTTVIVTHRLGSIKFANRIIVMKDGTIEGIGTHNELISSCPIYNKMWESQCRYYKSNLI